ncbi:MAG: RNA-binding S4 domain-containing protein [Thermodesulfobacteriota bacterium]
MDNNLRKFEIDQEPLELYKILKLDNQVQSGGEAKFVISEGLVKVNNEVETRKAKKIYNNDIIDFEGEKILIKLKS